MPDPNKPQLSDRRSKRRNWQELYANAAYNTIERSIDIVKDLAVLSIYLMALYLGHLMIGFLFSGHGPVFFKGMAYEISLQMMIDFADFFTMAGFCARAVYLFFKGSLGQ